MKDLFELRQDARNIFAAALRSVDAGEAIRRVVRLDESLLTTIDSSIDLALHNSGVYVIAIGKAAPAMAAAIAGILDNRISGGIISGPVIQEREHETLSAFASDRWRFFAGGHPLPNQESLNAAQAGFDLLRVANEKHAPILFLISGGGSTMLEWPADARVSLDDLRIANRLLISCGASIAEINAVRRAFSAIKGAGLAHLAPNSPQISLIVSDTNSGDEGSVASGPTIEPPLSMPDARAVVDHNGDLSQLPASILNAIQSSRQSMKPLALDRALRKHYVLLDNQAALKAAMKAAGQLGFQTEIAEDIVDPDIAEGMTLLLSRLEALRTRTRETQPVCLVSGGEFRCPVRGKGRGGRNSETVLRLAIELNRRSSEGDIGRHVVLSGGTDGQDGNSPAAGAIADQTTISRASAAGLDPRRFLEESDSFSFFEKLGDTIDTGPTGTNVRDVRILLASPGLGPVAS